jgi:uncharacterized membrane protein YkoI
MISNLKTNLRTVLAGVLALALTFVAASTFAQPPAPRISMEQARRIALEHVPSSTVESIEHDWERGVEVFEVELRTDGGVEHELVIDANDGHVISANTDDDD